MATRCRKVAMKVQGTFSDSSFWSSLNCIQLVVFELFNLCSATLKYGSSSQSFTNIFYVDVCGMYCGSCIIAKSRSPSVGVLPQIYAFQYRVRSTEGGRNCSHICDGLAILLWD
jgi:hypothetical protein